MHIPSLKYKTKKQPITELKDASVYRIPLQSYRSTLQSLVKINDQILQYQVLAEDLEHQFAAKIHSPVSGKVIAIDEHYISLENDFQQQKITTEIIEFQQLDLERFVQVLKDFGIAGIGGAEFPTNIKYKVEESKIKLLLINGVECEPYLTSDYAVMRHETEKLLQTIAVLNQIFQPEEIVIGIEKQHKELKKHFEKSFKNHPNLAIRIHLLPNEYPQGGELQFIKSVTNTEIPKGSIPVNFGYLVSNVGTILAIYEALFNGIPTTERVITISGNAVNSIGNYRVKIGTPIRYILEELRIEAEDVDIVLGGPMMGKEVVDLDSPIKKGSGGLLLFKKQQKSIKNCIECGYCVDVCPQHLMPMQFVKGHQEDQNLLIQFNLDHCIECGACEYICPSNLPLMQSIVLGKVELQKMIYAK